MFRYANNTHVSGAASFVHNEHFNFGSGAESLDEGIRLLSSRVVKSAMHNSGERFDAPTCHEETRTAIQVDILGWADELVNDLNELVTWLYGPAGAGESAIAQTIAQKLHARGQLTASFFFSRASGSAGRGAETDFVATLAHQLSQSVPATKPHIAAAVRENPLVFDLALQDQADVLIVAPLIAVSNPLSGPSRPRVIVVDGLDECKKEKDAQRRVVDALISGLRRIPHQSHKLLITSRPEAKIMAIFKKYEGKLLRRMELNNEWNPNHDIRTYLNASFADIRRSHYYFRGHPVDETWPGPDDIDILVHRSSGQFIYASVVFKYIKSEENYNPVTRLETILTLSNNGDQPYAELDALYKYVFSQMRDDDRLRVLIILSMHQEYDDLTLLTNSASPFPTLISEFIGMHMDEIKFHLLPLVSLLVWQEEIHYLHASLLDFLLDQSRSDVFCINSLTVAAEIVRRAVELFEDGTALKGPMWMSVLMAIPRHYANMLPSDQKFHIYSLISNFNVVEAVLCKIDPEFMDIGDSSGAINSYLAWVLKESNDKNASYYLSKSAAQIQTWLVNQCERLQFKSLDNSHNTEQIDLRPFFMRRHTRSSDDCKISIKRLSEDLSSAVEICGSSPTYHKIQQTNFSLSHETAVLCYLMSRSEAHYGSRSWFFRPDLFGRYAMTSEQYGVALQHIAYYILQLPKHTLLEILTDSNSEEDAMLETPIMRLIRQVLDKLLFRSPPTTDLYFLVALVYPVMRSIDPWCRAWDHLSKALKEFPFLKDWNSWSYVLAKAKVEESCNNLKIKTSLHELAEMEGIELHIDGSQLVGYKELLRVFNVIDRRIPESG